MPLVMRIHLPFPMPSSVGLESGRLIIGREPSGLKGEAILIRSNQDVNLSHSVLQRPLEFVGVVKSDFVDSLTILTGLDVVL